MAHRASLNRDHTFKQPGVNYCGTLTLGNHGFDLASGYFGAEYLFRSEIGVNEDAIMSATVMAFDRFKKLAAENNYMIDHEGIEHQVLCNGVATEAIFQIASKVKQFTG